MGQFTMYTDTVSQLGGHVSNNAEDFGVARKKIDEIVERVYASELKQKLGEETYNTIKSYDALLNKIQAKLDAYGQNAVTSANDTAALSEEKASEVRKYQL